MTTQFHCKIINQGYQEALNNFFDEDELYNGKMHVKLSYAPEIWQSLQVLGRKNEIILIYDKLKTRVAATMICSLNNSYFHGKLIKTLYVSGLKVGSNYRKTAVITKLLNTFKLYWKENDVEIILFSVFSSNTTGLKLFSGKSNLLPLSTRAGELNTYVFKKRSLRCRENPTFKISIASNEDVPDIVKFIDLEGLSRSNFPNYSKEELIDDSGILKGFSITNLAIAKNKQEIVGIMGLWDQTNYRQWLVKNYSSIICSLRPLINILATLLGYPRLPAVNNLFSYKMLSLVICKNNSVITFKHLFNYLMDHDLDEDANYGITLLSTNPLIKLFKPKSVVFSSILFKAAYPENLSRMNMLNFNNLYVEQARL